MDGEHLIWSCEGSEAEVAQPSRRAQGHTDLIIRDQQETPEGVGQQRVSS